MSINTNRMARWQQWTVAVASVAVMASPSHAQSAEQTRDRAIVLDVAAIMLVPDALRTPLRVAAKGTSLILVQEEGEWLQVQFLDPQLGVRTGYVRRTSVRVERAALQPLDLSVRSAESSATAESRQPPVRSAPPIPANAPRLPGRASQGGSPIVYITPTADGFETYLAAAIIKKKVRASVTTDPDLATLTLTTALIEEEEVSTGKRLVNCLFVYCAGNENKASTSVTVTDSSGSVLWSYSVNKGRGSKNRQSMAEAIAEHLKDDYLR